MIWPERLITPLFRTWWRLQRSVTLGARAIACDAEGGVCLVRHGYSHGWHLPGGGVEHGENALNAIVRELAEEAGIEVTEPPVLFGFYANHINFPNDHVAVYRVGAWRPVTPRGGREIAERGFFALDALPEATTPGTRRRLAEAFQGAKISADW